MVHMSEDGSAVIGINDHHYPNRKRFTLAHEIGHYLLHAEEGFHIDEKSPIAFRDENSGLANDSWEVEANQFAAALLMPEKFLREDFRKLSHKSAEDAIDDLADKYEVSTQAMSFRVQALKMLV
jgi:Zn-dependent peptidase ImmA (M78 family)